MEGQAGNVSVREAKQRLLDWSGQADEAIHREVGELIATARQRAHRAIPWAAGAALLMGLLAVRGKRDSAGRSMGLFRKGIGVLRTGIKVAMFVLPLARPLFAGRPREH